MTELTELEVTLAGSILVTEDVSIADFGLAVGTEFVTGTGTAKRNPIDKPDQLLAAYLSSARALRSVAKQLQKQANIRENELAHIAASKRPPKVVGGTLHPKNKVKKSTAKKLAAKKITMKKLQSV